MPRGDIKQVNDGWGALSRVHGSVSRLAVERLTSAKRATTREGAWWMTCRFRASLKHKDDGQTKFTKLNSQI